MIFPFLNGVLGFDKAPFTWGLLALNILVFVFSFGMKAKSDRVFAEIQDDELFRKTNGVIFARFIQANPESYPPLYQKLSHGALSGNADNLQSLAILGVRDATFIAQANLVNNIEDKVALEHWRKQLTKLNLAQNYHPSFQFGVTLKDFSPITWLTYQFAHSGFVHLASNMLFLLFFGCFLEPIIGGGAFLFLYLASGAMAAVAFLLISGPSLVPLVGASGSISGLLAFFAAIYGTRAVRFIWFVGVAPGQFGFIYIPGWIALVMWFIPDLAGYLSEVSELGGVAYTAHMGGELAGLFMGVFIYLARYYENRDWLDTFDDGVQYKAFERTTNI